MSGAPTASRLHGSSQCSLATCAGSSCRICEPSPRCSGDEVPRVSLRPQGSSRERGASACRSTRGSLDPSGERAASPPPARPGLPDHLRPSPPPPWGNSRPTIPLPLGGYLACPARLWHDPRAPIPLVVFQVEQPASDRVGRSTLPRATRRIGCLSGFQVYSSPKRICEVKGLLATRSG
jgi:hypothetical protein